MLAISPHEVGGVGCGEDGLLLFRVRGDETKTVEDRRVRVEVGVMGNGVGGDANGSAGGNCHTIGEGKVTVDNAAECYCHPLILARVSYG